MEQLVPDQKAEVWQTYEDWSPAALLDGRIPMRKKVTIDRGTLVIDMYDTAAKKLVWSGTGVKAVDPNSTLKQKQQVIQALLKNYSPAP